MFNVLLVDDSSMDLFLLEEIVKESLPFDKTIQKFTDSQRAIDSWKLEKYNLIITDIEMPNVSGFDFIESIKNKPNQKIIAVSGSVADDSANETILYAANAYGADYAISKENLFNNLSALLSSLYQVQH